jgi:hypothetical protein
MKLARLIDPGFQKSITSLAKQSLPLKTAWLLRAVVKNVEGELIRYEELRKEALVKYGKKAEDGTVETDELHQVQFDQKGMQAFAADIGDLVNIEVDLPTITLAELGEEVKLSVEDIMNLDGLLKAD